MDNHPIPQDITGFQFKLIGAMTVRQFVYLAAGALVAVFFLFIVPIPFLIGLIIAIISFSIGAAFAFLPVDGRPLDTMVGNFFKALFAPTKYIYKKNGGDAFAIPQTTLTSQALPTAPPQAQTPVPQPSQPPLQPQSPQAPPQVDWQKKLAEAEEQRIALQKELEALKASSQTPLSQPQPQSPAIPPQPPQQMTPPPPPRQFPPPEKPPYGAPPPKQAPLLAMPDSPNLIVGIISDPRGNPLQNILVEVKDEEGNPVRAFKTNGLGQFAGATPLANGKYILVFEDPKGVNKFDSIQIEAVGNPIPPVQITSIDAREELRRELFN